MLNTFLISIGVDIPLVLMLTEALPDDDFLKKIALSIGVILVNAILIPLVMGMLKVLRKKIATSKKLSDKAKSNITDLIDGMINELDKKPKDEDKEKEVKKLKDKE